MRIQTVQSSEDFALAAKLIRAYFGSWGLEDLSEEPELVEELAVIHAVYGPPDGAALVAWLDEEPSGVVALKRFDERSCVMKRMFVLPAFRRRSVARALAVELLDVAERLGYSRMVLDTPEDNTGALNLYRSLGFTDIEPYHDPNHDHVHEDWSFLEAAIPPPDDQEFENIKSLLETAYLSTDNIYRQSGSNAGTAERWELTRSIVADAIDRDGTFLDVGCANGLLMESVAEWCLTKGVKIEPYGVDISEKLAMLARKRLPHWADRIFVGNSWTWEPPLKFDLVASRSGGGVPDRLKESHMHRMFDRFVAPGGRLIVHWSGLKDGDDQPWPEILTGWGFDVGAELVRRNAAGDPVSRAVWIDR